MELIASDSSELLFLSMQQLEQLSIELAGRSSEALELVPRYST